MPSSRQVKLRDGTIIGLSSHPADITTAFVVFGKGDYGEIPRGSVVIDVGANIGCFSLFAARSGAARVLAFEPCSESYEVLVDNLERNACGSLVEARQLAVSARAGNRIRFPRQSNPSNRISESGTRRDTDEVETTSLSEILRQYAVDRVDLLKLDCEGEEYPIVFDAAPDVWRRIAEIRLEYHRGRARELREYFTVCGYTVVRHVSRTVDGEQQGDLWVRRSLADESPRG